MLRFRSWSVASLFFSWLFFSLVTNFTWAQSETATVSGQVVDPSGLNVTGAQVKLVDIDRDTTTGTATNTSGLYTFPSVRPGRYRMEVTAVGFKVVNVTGVTVNVQDHLEQNFKLVVGSVSESITVEGGAPLVDTESATVSTLVDRNFAENLPMNGRSFQTLIQLTPGVVLVASNANDSGQFSVNGQRAASNYWTVDGVSANIGVSSSNNPGNGLGGTLGSFSVLGGTNSLVSVDAMQEFRIQTSTFAPEFGRTPGAQISIVTRSGTNQFHGTAFDYFRNGKLDANNWFADANHLPKPEERQNDFGGVFGGPILRDKTFFFFSYEGLRLLLPQVAVSTVPDAFARQQAVPAMQPYLNAFPVPNGTDNLTTEVAQFNSSYSNPASLDAYSLRIDHKLRENLTLFGRYNYSPSQSNVRSATTLSVVQPALITTQTTSTGATWIISPTITNDLRLNYSRTNGQTSHKIDSFGGAIPLTTLPFPNGFTSQNSSFGLYIFTLNSGAALLAGESGQNVQRQINVVDNVSFQKGTHSLKFGVDFRRLSPSTSNAEYGQTVSFFDVPSSLTGNSGFGGVGSSAPATLLFHNLGLFAQDTWRIAPHLNVTYGLRWDVDFAPSSLHGPNIPAVTGYNLNDFSQLAIAPVGTPAFRTSYHNVAPRVGIAYQFARSQDWAPVLRGGFGVFYDLATSEAGSLVSTSFGSGFAPFGAANFNVNGPFPFSSAEITPLPIPATGNLSGLYVFNPALKLPYTLEWNVALQQALGKEQSISVSYIGASGRRLLQTTEVFEPPTNPNLGFGLFVDNTASSDYDALQIQFQRRLLHHVQALASYSWSHSTDTGSAGSTFYTSNNGVPGNSNENRGPSDFDIRNAFSAGLTFDIPGPKTNVFTNAILGGWSVESLIQARSAPPVFLADENFYLVQGGIYADVRPDLVPGQPLYLYGSACASMFQTLGELNPGQPCPGGKGFNPNGFTNPPSNPDTGIPLRQGDVPRNVLRGFGAAQWDYAVHRNFSIHESLKLQFRAEIFNVLNHPNFGSPSGAFGFGGFGIANQMLGQYLDGGGIASNAGGGSFSPLYQIGGPRSIQLALKLLF
jgi:hypothetical protein